MSGDGVFEKAQGLLRDLTDEELLDRLDELASQERQIGASMVAHLVEVERRGLHLKWGHASVYTYCMERLGLTEDVAYKRMQAARAAALYPEVLDHLASGELTLTSLRMITPHLEEFGTALIDEARGKSSRTVQRIVAELAARPEPDRVKMEPVVGGRVRIEVVADAELEEPIEEAVNLDRHIDPHGNVGGLLTRALGAYVKQRRKARFAELGERESGEGAAQVDTEAHVDMKQQSIPAAQKRATVKRDGMQCTWEGPDGHRCTEKGFLELDHESPRARGGDHSKLRVLCRAHNQYAADQELGEDFMNEKRRQSRAPQEGRDQEEWTRGRQEDDRSRGREDQDWPRGRQAEQDQDRMPGTRDDDWPRGRGFLTREETIAAAHHDLMTICDFTSAEADARIREVLPQMRPDFFVREELWTEAREAHIRRTGRAAGSARGS